MTKNVLFLFDRWCNGDPRLGTTTHFHNFLATFEKHQPDYQTHTLHYDESALVYEKHIDQVLLRYCLSFDIKVVFLIFSGQSPANPSFNALTALKQYGIKVCVFYPDSNPLDLEAQVALEPIVDLIVPIDNATGKIEQRKVDSPQYLYLWVPQSTAMFYPQEKNIAVSFVGSTRYPERAEFIRELTSKCPEIVLAGGQRETQLSHEAYASLIRRSRMSINFCGNPMGDSYTQIKSRVFEATHCASLLFEPEWSPTSRLFEAGKEYITFNSVVELARKIQYYSENDEERARIAEAGYNKAKARYSACSFWDKVMEKLKII